MGEEFCVVCGRTDAAIVDGVCPKCYAERNPLVTVPERPKVTICPTCGARRIGAHWEGRGRSPELLGSEDLLPFLRVLPGVTLRTVDWTDEGTYALQREISGLAHLRFRGEERTMPLSLTVRLEHRTCEECSRRSGHYYTSTIQLRAVEDEVREKAADRRARLWRQWEDLLPETRADWQRALSWAEERPEGWDVYATDTLAARSISRLAKAKLSATLKESATLWGRKNGQDVYRVTFCLRIPISPESAAEPKLRGGGRSTAAPRASPRTAAL